MPEKKEYIERELVMSEIQEIFHNTDPNGEEQVGMLKCHRVIRTHPAADVAPVVHGEWVKTSDFMPIYGCSICKERNLFKDGNNVFSNHCPNCGAKMDGGEHEPH